VKWDGEFFSISGVLDLIHDDPLNNMICRDPTRSFPRSSKQGNERHGRHCHHTLHSSRRQRTSPRHTSHDHEHPSLHDTNTRSTTRHEIPTITYIALVNIQSPMGSSTSHFGKRILQNVGSQKSKTATDISYCQWDMFWNNGLDERYLLVVSMWEIAHEIV